MTPAQVLEVNVAAHAGVAREVRVVEHGVVEAVVRERIAVVVVLGPQGPVVTKTFGAQHQDAVVALLVVLDDGQGLVGLAQAHGVRDDAALVLLELADGAHNGIALEVVELVPHHGLLELEAGAQVVVDVTEEVAEQVVEREEVDELGRVLAVEGLDLGGHLVGDVGHHGRVVPDLLEHELEAGGLGGALEVAHAHNAVGTALVAQALQREVCGGAVEGVVVAVGVLHHVGAPGHDDTGHLGRAELAPGAHPLGALVGDGTLVEVVAERELKAGAAHAALAHGLGDRELAGVLLGGHSLDERGLAEQEANRIGARELVLEFAVGKHGEVAADNREA